MSDRRWLACVLDTEGCITAHVLKDGARRIQLSVAMTSRGFLEEFKQRAGFTTRISSYSRANRRHKVQFTLKTGSKKDIHRFLTQVQKYLIIKGDKAGATIRYLSRRIKRGNVPHDQTDIALFDAILRTKDTP